MKTSCITRALSASLFLGGIASTSQAQYSGWLDRVSVTNTLSASVGYTSNVGYNQSGIDDFFIEGEFISSITREFKVVTLGISLDARANNYFENDEANDQNFSLGWIIATDEEFGTRRTVFDVGLNVSESTGQENDTDGIVTQRQFAANASLSYLLTRQASIGASVRYAQTDPRGGVKNLVGENEVNEVDNLTGIESLEASAFGSWIATPDTSFTLTGSVLEVSSDKNQSQDGTIYSLSLSVLRQLTAKLNWTLSGGVSRRQLDTVDDDQTTPIFAASLDYIIDERTGLSLEASRRMGSSITGGNSINNDLTLSFDRELTRTMSFNASMSYNLSEIDFNTDPLNPIEENRSTLRFSVGVFRALNEWANVGASAIWSTTETDFETRGDYDRTTVQLTATARF